MVALPGGWLVPAATVVQCGWRDVLGDLMRSSAWSEPEPLAEPEPVASLPAPSIAPSAARTRGLRNAPLAAQRPQTAAASPAASSSTIHGTDKVPLSHVQSSSSPIMTRPDLEPPCAPGNPSSRSSSASTLSAATLVLGPLLLLLLPTQMSRQMIEWPRAGAAAPPAPPAESRREQDSPAPPAESRSEKDSPAGLTLHRGDKRGTFPESHFQRFCFTCSNHPVAQYGPFPFPALCSGSQCRFLRGTVHDHL